MAAIFDYLYIASRSNTDHQIFTDLGGLSIETPGMVEGQPEVKPGAQGTAHSERTKPGSPAKRFHAVSQASMMSARLRKHRVGQPVAAQIMPDALDRIELLGCRAATPTSLMLSGIASAWLSCQRRRSASEDLQQGVGRGADLAADLAQMMRFIAMVLQIGMMTAAALPSLGQTAPNT